MAHDQYTIPPFNSDSSALNEALHAAESARGTSEVAQPINEYAFIGESIALTDSFHETALAMNARKKGMWKRTLELVVVDSESPIDKLINSESFIVGGTMFPSVPGARFWLNKQHDDDPVGVRNWTFSYKDMHTKQRVDITYQTTNNSIHKIFNGLERPIPEEERTNIMAAIRLYPEIVRRELYPFDQDLYDLAA